MEELQLTDLFKFVDSHVHLYDMKHPTLHYGHWQPDEDLPLKELGNRNYLANDFFLRVTLNNFLGNLPSSNFLISKISKPFEN